MLNKRQFVGLSAIEAVSNERSAKYSDVEQRLGTLAKLTIEEFVNMGLIERSFSIDTSCELPSYTYTAVYLTDNGIRAICDYKDSRREIWAGRLFHFLSGLASGLLTGVGLTLLTFWLTGRL